MTPEQQRRVRDLFEQAIDRAPTDADAWVRAQAGDAIVRDEVLALLAHHSRAGDFLSRPLVERVPSLLDDEPYAAGSSVGPYTIEREVGRGGMGRVYRARDERLGRTVALKVLAPALVGDPAQRERLRREARAAAALTHPGICTVYALEEIDGELAIATEFVDGVTLRDAIAAGRGDPDATATARELAAALASAHARGIVHRDLKPENIMRAVDGRLKILDFGLARIAQPGEADVRAATLTRAGVLLGTPAYMAPEQLRHEEVDARADVFAFGVVMYEYVCGVHPLRAERPNAIPGVLGRVIGRCLREVPAERYASAAEIAAALESEPDVGSGTSWWRTHQLAIVALYAIAAVLAWQIKEWRETAATVGVFLALGAVATGGGVLRGHLVFTERVNRPRLAAERRRTALAVRVIDGLAALLMFVDGLLIAPARALPAVFAFAVALGIALAALVLEPATTAAAFGEER